MTAKRNTKKQVADEELVTENNEVLQQDAQVNEETLKQDEKVLPPGEKMVIQDMAPEENLAIANIELKAISAQRFIRIPSGARSFVSVESPSIPKNSELEIFTSLDYAYNKGLVVLGPQYHGANSSGINILVMNLSKHEIMIQNEDVIAEARVRSI